MPAERVTRLLARNGKHRHVVEPCIVQAGHQVRGAGARGGDAHAQLTGELGVSGSHERRHFLVAGLDELDLAVCPVERAEHSVDAVAGIAKDLSHSPGVEPLDDEVSDSLCHGQSSRWSFEETELKTQFSNSPSRLMFQ